MKELIGLVIMVICFAILVKLIANDPCITFEVDGKQTKYCIR